MTPNEIENFSLREMILRRPRMYIGHDLDSHGLHFLVLEIIRLAANPDTSNHCTVIQVSLMPDGWINIKDDGRGLPVTLLQPWNNGGPAQPAIERVVTNIVTNHPNREYYAVYGFLDYLAVVLNVVTAELVIETRIDGNANKVHCARGSIIEPLSIVGPCGESGTHLQFQPDPNVFAEPCLEGELMRSGLQQLAREYPQVQFLLQTGNDDVVRVNGA